MSSSLCTRPSPNSWKTRDCPQHDYTAFIADSLAAERPFSTGAYPRLTLILWRLLYRSLAKMGTRKTFSAGQSEGQREPEIRHQ